MTLNALHRTYGYLNAGTSEPAVPSPTGHDYRLRHGGSYVPFHSITSAENHRLDNSLRAFIELWYKGRWNIMGDIPQPKRMAL